MIKAVRGARSGRKGAFFMAGDKYLKLLVEDLHSAAVATLGPDGRPQLRIIDMMLWDEGRVYFLTARGKAFYAQLLDQGYVALSAVKGKVSVSLRGKVKPIGSARLGEIFEKNPYMQSIYPGDTRAALEVFCLYEGQGEYFDISDPAHVVRDDFTLGGAAPAAGAYRIGPECTGCGLCAGVCPQSYIDTGAVPAVIDPRRCLRCGRCREVCPRGAIKTD